MTGTNSAMLCRMPPAAEATEETDPKANVGRGAKSGNLHRLD